VKLYHLCLSHLLVFGLALPLAQAQDYLSFPLNKSEIKVLPQRFEYQLLDKDRFRIGDILFDANRLDFKISPKGKDNYSIKFSWPASLLTKGDILIKDNAGKAIWQQNMEKGHLLIQKSNISMDESQYRTDTATFTVNTFDSDHFTKIRNSPFFRFCVHREEALTRIYLCSKELYFKHEGRRLIFKSRDSLRPDSFVEINGRVVGGQGTIFLQSADDALSMSAQLASGASIVIDTRLKAVDFVDVAITEDKTLTVKAKGAEPVNEEDVLARTGDIWSAKLNLGRPTIYLRGEGDIPMRQEFVVTGKIRPDSLQIPIISKAGQGTYSKSNTVQLTAPAGVSIRELDKKSVVSKNTDGSFSWEVKELEPGASNVRFVTITTPDAEYVGSWDFFRGLKNEIYYSFLLPAESVDLKFQQAINNRWQWNVGYLNFVQRLNSEPTFSAESAQFKYALKPGANPVDLNAGLSASMEEYNSNNFNILGFTLGGYLSTAMPSKYKDYFDNYGIALKIPFAGTGSGYTVAPSLDADLTIKKQTGTWSWQTGLRLQSYRFTGTNTEVDINRTSIILGISQFF